MSVPTPELPRPLPARTWREQLAGLAESFDVSPRRLLVGAVALTCIGVVGWRLLAPPPPPAEMRLPFAQPSQAGDGGADPSSDTGGGAGGNAQHDRHRAHRGRRPRGGRRRVSRGAAPAAGQPGDRCARGRRRGPAGRRPAAHQPGGAPGGRAAGLRAQAWRRAPGAGRRRAPRWGRGRRHRWPGPRRPRRPQHRHRRAAGHAARRRAGDGGGDHRAPRRSTGPSPRSTSCSTCAASARRSSSSCATSSRCEAPPWPIAGWSPSPWPRSQGRSPRPTATWRGCR